MFITMYLHLFALEYFLELWKKYSCGLEKPNSAPLVLGWSSLLTSRSKQKVQHKEVRTWLSGGRNNFIFEIEILIGYELSVFYFILMICIIQELHLRPYDKPISCTSS